MDVKLWGKTRALKLAARAGMHALQKSPSPFVVNPFRR
jgi:hypothetical protein